MNGAKAREERVLFVIPALKGGAMPFDTNILRGKAIPFDITLS